MDLLLGQLTDEHVWEVVHHGTEYSEKGLVVVVFFWFSRAQIAHPACGLNIELSFPGRRGDVIDFLVIELVCGRELEELEHVGK